MSELRPFVGRDDSLCSLWQCGRAVGDSRELSKDLSHPADYDPDNKRNRLLRMSGAFNVK